MVVDGESQLRQTGVRERVGFNNVREKKFENMVLTVATTTPLSTGNLREQQTIIDKQVQ